MIHPGEANELDAYTIYAGTNWHATHNPGFVECGDWGHSGHEILFVRTYFDH